MNKKKVSKRKAADKPSTKMTAGEFAFTAKTVFDELLKKGFTTDQSFQLTRDVVQAMCR